MEPKTRYQVTPQKQTPCRVEQQGESTDCADNDTKAILPSIPLPPNWSQPKYRFGQLVEQGWIVGLKYYPEASALGYQKSEWQYHVLPNWVDSGGDIIPESKIKPYPPEKMNEELQTEINIHLRQIENLKFQMNNAA
jgi:hypothetical protein